MLNGVRVLYSEPRLLKQCCFFFVSQQSDCHQTKEEHNWICERQDDCHSSPCLNGGTCRVGGNGRFRCDCPPGTAGGVCAITDDKCASGPCGNGATCTSLPNAYRCTCTPQWTGARCQDDVNECAYHQLHSCIRGREKCTNTVGSYECACRDGLTGDTCETIVHDCSSRNPCLNGGQCRTVASGYVCDCRVGYIGRDCQHHDACASNPCRQGC